MLDLFSFFFQAEDGIRDREVQTCALPISVARVRDLDDDERAPLVVAPRACDGLRFAHNRSEERRVGKESRGGGVLGYALNLKVMLPSVNIFSKGYVTKSIVDILFEPKDKG